MSESADGVGYRLDAGVATIELRRSALDAPLRGELLAAVRQVGSDGTAVRAVLLTARGKHFCVGQDLKEHARALENGPESAFACVRDEYNPLVEALHALTQPVVVAVEGACVGAGLGLALCADVRVAAEGARFAAAFTGIGLAADSGLSGSLAQAVGPSRAAALMLLGDRFGAEDALRWGWCTGSYRTVALRRRGWPWPRGWPPGPLSRTRRSRRCCGTRPARVSPPCWSGRRRRRSGSARRGTTGPP